MTVVSPPAPGSFVIVTGGDSHYFPLLNELVASLRALRARQECPICVLDAGLKAQERAQLESEVEHVVTPEWGYDLPARRIRGRNFLKANVAKVWLPKYLPGYETIIWIDGDAWVQDWAAIELLRQGAAGGAFAVVAQSGRYFETQLHVNWVLGPFARIRSILFKNARRSGLSMAESRALALKPTLNAGAYALRRDAPHWAAFQAWQARIIHRGRIFTNDQLAMGAAVYLDGLPVELLPDWCNYMGPWRFDAERRLLVESYLPRRPLGIVHLAGEDAMRADPSVLREILDLDGRPHRMSLRYPAWAGRRPALAGRDGGDQP